MTTFEKLELKSVDYMVDVGWTAVFTRADGRSIAVTETRYPYMPYSEFMDYAWLEALQLLKGET